MPKDVRSNDVVHWQTMLVTEDAGNAASRVRVGAADWVSPGAVSMPDGALSFAEGALVHDPDGHVMMLIAFNKRPRP